MPTVSLKAKAAGGQVWYSHDDPQVCFVFCMKSTQSSSGWSPNVALTYSISGNSYLDS